MYGGLLPNLVPTWRTQRSPARRPRFLAGMAMALGFLAVCPLALSKADDEKAKTRPAAAPPAVPAGGETIIAEPRRREPPPAPAADVKPMPKKKAAQPSNVETSGAVLDELIAADAKTTERNRIDAKALFDRSKALEAAGKSSEALRLAKQARALDPTIAELAPWVARLQKETLQRQQANAPIIRARAHIAAALARADVLHSQRRYASQEDLLKGVAEACALFRDAASVEAYRKIANEQLARLAAVHQLRPASIKGEDLKNSDQADAFRLGYGMPAPENFRRLYSAHSFEMPRWYRVQKAALAKQLNVDYKHAPAAMVFDDLADRAGIQLLIDTPITESRAHLNATVDLRATELPAETLLNIACAKTGLEYVIVERAVVITSPDKALEYARNLPEIVRNHWAAARMLFPDIDAALLATSPAPSPGSEAVAGVPDAGLIPSYLRSGKALVDDIRSLLK